MLSGYFGLPEKTLEAMENFWFHTGDQAYMDENGYVFFQDRLKDAIRRRGENISSFEVERLLNAHPEVAETAAIPVKSDVGEEEVKVVVVRREGSTLSEESLLRFCVETMPYFMVPRFIEFREQLPRTPTMKVKKVELRREGRTAGTWDCEAAGFRITRRGLERR
jgi:crotonobetaine/carnitine-CoA ligase